MRRSPARHSIQYPQPYYPPQPYYQPEPHGPSAGAIIGVVCSVVLTLTAIVMVAVFTWKATGGVLPGAIKPTAIGITTGSGATSGQNNTGAQSGASDVTAYNATADAQQAAAIAQPAVELPPRVVAAPAGVDTIGNAIPTAVVLIPTAIPVEQVVVIPQSMPVLAVDPLIPTAIPTMTYPTPLPAAVASNFEISPDGTCITAPRAGKRYQVCQGWKYTPTEAVTVADLIRGGTLPGVEVQ